MLQVRQSCVELSSCRLFSLNDWSVTSVGHIAENCSSEQRLCYNCRQPGHESAACPSPRSVAGKQCYSCGGVGHIQAECPSLRLQNSGQKCYVSKQVLPVTIHPRRLSYIRLSELWPVRTLRALLPQRRWWRFRLACATSRACAEYIYPSPSQVLPLRRP